MPDKSSKAYMAIGENCGASPAYPDTVKMLERIISSDAVGNRLNPTIVDPQLWTPKGVQERLFLKSFLRPINKIMLRIDPRNHQE